jgi:hypothetical protein
MKEVLKKWELEKPLLVWRDNKTMPNPELAVEFQTTYGLPIRNFVEFVNSKMENPLERLYWIARAYDEFHNTKTRSNVFSI